MGAVRGAEQSGGGGHAEAEAALQPQACDRGLQSKRPPGATLKAEIEMENIRPWMDPMLHVAGSPPP